MKRLELLSVGLLLLIITNGFGSSALIRGLKEAEVKTSGGALTSRVAPGEFLPISPGRPGSVR